MKPQFAALTLVIILFACESEDVKPTSNAKRLSSVISYFEHEPGNFEPGDRSVYAYDSKGRLAQRYYSTYDVVEEKFQPFSTERFTFDGDRLIKIEEVILGTDLRKITTYEYTVDKLTAIHIDDEIDTDITISYLPNNLVEALYTHSNGRWFKYRFSSSNENITSEQTFNDSGELSAEISNEFDAGINPYTLLGYTDPFFTNSSRNNKTKTQSEYHGGFPLMVPTAYEYSYNEENLPTQQLTTYTSYPDAQSSRQLKRVFEYL